MTVLRTSEEPVVSVIILSYANLEFLGECLSSIARSVDGAALPYEVVVLFQQHSPASVAAFLKNVSGVRPLQMRVNLGFGAGNNFAAEHAKGRYLVFLNDDTEPQAGWLQALVDAAREHANAGAVASRILFPDGSLQEAGGIIWSDGSTRPLGRGEPSGSLAFSYVRPVDYASANGLLVRRDDFRSLGGFDPRFFPAYYEDTDLCLGLRHRLQRDIIYEPRSAILHVEAASVRDDRFRSFLFRRNQAALMEKWSGVLAGYPAPEPESAVAIERAVLRRRGDPTRVLVLDDRLPDAGQSSGGLGSGFVRARELFEELAVSEFAVTFAPTDRRNHPRRNAIGHLGVDVVTGDLVAHLRAPEKRYDAIVISRPHNYAAYFEEIRRAQPQAAVIYDVEALYHKRLEAQARLETNPRRRERLEAEALAMERVELAIARTVDRLVAISGDELAWLQTIEGHAPIDFMRPLLSGIALGPAALDGRAGAVFVAGWLGGGDSPNVDAAVWYCNAVLPRVVEAVPDFRTLVTGNNPPPAVQALASDRFVLTGFVESMAALYAGARAAVVPTRIGAGVKNKTMEALQFGVPVVATRVGAEGLGLIDGDAIDIADDAGQYADRLIALLSDDGVWHARRRAIETHIARWETERASWRQTIAAALERAANDERLTLQSTT